MAHQRKKPQRLAQPTLALGVREAVKMTFHSTCDRFKGAGTSSTAKTKKVLDLPLQQKQED